MDKFSAELYAGYDPVLLEAWRNATVGIAGAGGLGSNAAIALARAGIGKLIIADYDNVSASNLTRQQYFQNQIGLPKVAALQDTLRRINPSTYVSAYPSRVTPVNLDSIFGKATILIEAFDDAGEKEMLIETWQSLFPQRYIIAASGIAGVGKNELIKIEQSGTLFIVGDGVSEVEPGILPISARVAVVANMQANLCLEILAGKRQ
ncbi:MAG TPA: sulfur carrier protein ThiS adenylyltransferase ThiF [Candidatus Syntrophosphaera sp.]|jgi:sulfur carrier protein ThiS adenylyltransferase|nr:sulfur carrier protein ThiS adenylyltransferase ThiF [Candidatus Syntrophosphaera sp.]